MHTLYLLRHAKSSWSDPMLPDRERRIVELRFFESMTQSEIAERVGVSQMHVSRLLTRSLERLRAEAGR